MANVLKMAEVYAIYALLERGWSRRRIAEALGIDRETVARYARLAVAGEAFPGAPLGWEAPKPAKAPPGSGADATRIHGTTRQQVGKVFTEVERPALLPLPVDRFPCFQEAQRSVHQDGHVEVAKAYYSVPPEYLQRRVWVRWDGYLVRIFDQQLRQIAVHAQREPGRFATDERHIHPRKAPPQTQFEFIQEHPLIRSLAEYEALVHDAFQEKRA